MKRASGTLLILVSCTLAFSQEPNQGISLTQAQEQTAISYLTTKRGFKRKELDRLKTENVGEYRQMLARAVQESRELAEIESRDPELFARMTKEQSLDAKIRNSAREYRKTKAEPRRKELRGQVEKLVAEQFDLREEHRKDAIKRLEQELKRLKEAAPRRAAHKAEIVARHVDELLGDADLYAW